jgi:hypothetical protein
MAEEFVFDDLEEETAIDRLPLAPYSQSSR